METPSSRQSKSTSSLLPTGAQSAPSASTLAVSVSLATACVAVRLRSPGAPAAKVAAAAAAAAADSTTADRRDISGSTGTGDRLSQRPSSAGKPSRTGLHLLFRRRRRRPSHQETSGEREGATGVSATPQAPCQLWGGVKKPCGRSAASRLSSKSKGSARGADVKVDTGTHPHAVTTVIARSSFMSVQTLSEETAIAAAAVVDAAAAAAAAAADAVTAKAASGVTKSARRTTSLHTAGVNEGLHQHQHQQLMQMAVPASHAGAKGRKEAPVVAPISAKTLPQPWWGSSGAAPVQPSASPLASSSSPPSPPLPSPRRRKTSRLRRIWIRFKHIATCSSVKTFDPPLHGVALAPGETVEDIAKAAAAAAATKTSLVPAGVPPRDLPAATPPAAATAARSALQTDSSSCSAPSPPPTCEETPPLPPRRLPSSADSEPSRNDTGYFTTPAQWRNRGSSFSAHHGGSGRRESGGGPVTAQPPADTHSTALGGTGGGSSVQWRSDPDGLYAVEQLDNGSSGARVSGSGQPGAPQLQLQLRRGGGGFIDHNVSGGGGGDGGGGSSSTGGRTPPAQRLLLLPGVGSSSGVAMEGRSSLADKIARRRESLSSIPTIGSVEEDWYDARSVASTFSIMSCFNTSAAVNSTTAHPQHDGDGEHHHGDLQSPSLTHTHSYQHQKSTEGAATAKIVAEALVEQQMRETRQQGGGGDVAVAGAPPADEKHLPIIQKQGPLLPTTPSAPRRQTPPPEWSPAPPDSVSLTGHFSTPVLSAPHRTCSPAASNASAVKVAAAMDAAAAAAAAADGGAMAAALPPGATEMAVVVAVPLPLPLPTTPRDVATPVVGLPAGLPEAERPSWVPESPIPGLDPQTLFLPVPKVTGVAGYWAKIPELSAPIPMPIDIALNANRMARMAHESIKGILLRETDTQIIVKARLTLPLGVKYVHEERYNKDNSTYTLMIRRDVKPGKSITRMFYTADGDVLLVCESLDLAGRTTHIGYELAHVHDNGEIIRCRQWVLILHSGKMVEQYFVGRLAPLPAH